MTAITGRPEARDRRRYATAADLVRDLGDVPLDRILFDPLPGMATEQDLVRMVEGDEKRLCELVDGTLVEKPVGYEESLIAARLIHLLMSFVAPRRLGAVLTADGMIRLSPNVIRLPDVAFVSYARMPKGKVPRAAAPALSPELAVEILSPSNTRREIERKIAEYFAAGTDAVWVIDPATRSARVFSAPDAVAEVAPDGVLRGTGVLAGFEVKLAEVFVDLDAAEGQQ